MAKVGTVFIEVDADTAKLVKGVKRANNQLASMQRSFNKTKSDIANFAKAAAGFYVFTKATELATVAMQDFLATASSSEQYANRMSSFTQSIAQNRAELARATGFALDYNQSINQTTETLLLMKNYGLKDTTEQLKIYANTAMGSGKSVSQFAEAMADALTGENERLKEFGVKAAVQGQNVAYAWTDSSGKVRNVTIANNKDIIDSTLSAIFNEKYVGQLDAYASSWDGTIQGIKNQYSVFQSEVMDAGVYNYLKGTLSEVSAIATGMFAGGKANAKEYANVVIGGIKTIISAVGASYDIWNGIKAVYASIKVAFLSLVVGIGEGINLLGRGWDSFTTGAATAMKAWIDAAGKGFVGFVNFLLGGINKVVNGFMSLGSTVLEAMGMEGLQPIDIKMDPYVSSLEVIKTKSEDIINLDWSNSKLTEAATDLNGLMTSIINEDGSKRAAEAIANIDANVAKLTVTESKNNKEKDLARQKLDAIGAGYGGIGEKAKEAGAKAKKADDTAASSAKKAATEQKKIAEQRRKEMEKTAKEAEEYGNRFADSFSTGFDSMLHGDVKDSFLNFFDDIGGKMMKPFVDEMSKDLSTMLSGATAGLGNFGSLLTGGVMQIGTALLSEMFAGDTISDAEMKDAEGITGVLSESVINSIENIEKNGLLGLDYSKQMVDSLQLLVSLGNTAASNVGGDLTGDDYVSSTKTGFFNDRSKELVATGIALDPATIAELNAGQLTASEYMTEKITDSGFLGIGGGEKIKTRDLGQADDSVLDPINEAYLAGIETLQTSAEALGIGTEEFTIASEKWTTSMANLNFAGKSQSEIADMITGAISSDLDTLAGSLGSASEYIEMYKLAGEGQSETLFRLVNEFELVSLSFEHLGLTMPEVAMGGLALADSLAVAAGGIDQFLANMGSFTNNFYTDAEIVAMLGSDLTATMQTMGLSLPPTALGFRQVTEQAMITAAASQAEATALYAQAQAATIAGNAVAASAYQMAAAAAQLQADINAAKVNTLLSASADAAKYYEGMGTSIKEVTYQAAAVPKAVAPVTRSLGSSIPKAASSASTALKTVYASLTDIASLKSDWMDDASGAKLQLDAVIAETGIKNVNFDNFLEKFTQASSKKMTSDELSEWKDLSSALKSLENTFATKDDKLDLKADWIDELDAKKMQLEMVVQNTGLVGIDSSNFLEEFEKASLGEMSKDDLDAWEDLSKAIESLKDSFASATDKLDLKADWIDELDAKKMQLEMVVQNTGLVGIDSSNFLEEFEKASLGEMSKEQLDSWKDLSGAIKTLENALPKEATLASILAQSSNFASEKSKIEGEAWDRKIYEDMLLASQSRLQEIEESTNLAGVTYQNYLAEFAKAQSGGLTEEQLEDWQEMGDALLDVRTSAKALETTFDSLALSAQYASVASNFAMSQMDMRGEYDADVYQQAIDATGIALASVQKNTGLYGIDSSNYLSAFSSANQSGLSSEELAEWEALGDALLTVDSTFADAISAMDAEKAKIEELISSLDGLQLSLEERISFYENGAVDTTNTLQIEDMIAKIANTSDSDEMIALTEESMSMVDSYYSEQTALLTSMIDALDTLQNYVDNARLDTNKLVESQLSYSFYLQKVTDSVSTRNAEQFSSLVDMLTKSADAYLGNVRDTVSTTAQYEHERNIVLNDLEDLADNKDPLISAINDLQEEAVFWLKSINEAVGGLSSSYSASVGGYSSPTAVSVASAPVASVAPEPVSTALTTADLVGHVYKDILGRTADSAGLAYWTAQVESGSAVNFSNLGESLAVAELENGKMSRDAFVKLLYTEGLSRNPNQAEIDYWADDSGLNGAGMIQSFIQNDSSYHHFAEGGIVTGPTRALIGEAGYSEAVIPLKNPNDPLGQKELIEVLREELGELRRELKMIRDSNKNIDRNTKTSRIAI